MFLDIQLTKDEEKSSKLPYMNVSIQRHNDGELSTMIYRKSINTEQKIS